MSQLDQLSSNEQLLNHELDYYVKRCAQLSAELARDSEPIESLGSRDFVSPSSGVSGISTPMGMNMIENPEEDAKKFAAYILELAEVLAEFEKKNPDNRLTDLRSFYETIKSRSQHLHTFVSSINTTLRQFSPLRSMKYFDGRVIFAWNLWARLLKRSVSHFARDIGFMLTSNGTTQDAVNAMAHMGVSVSSDTVKTDKVKYAMQFLKDVDSFLHHV
jgi:hypothetical protein